MLDQLNRHKLEALNSQRVTQLVDHFIKLCKPQKVTVIDDSEEDIQYIRNASLKNCEEIPLKMQGHTYHFDGPKDQGRDKEHTRILLSQPVNFGFETETLDRDEGLQEIFELLDGIMQGKELYVRFFCLGPTNSPFAIRALQLTDSAYVAHSEDLLYRKAYEEFKNAPNKDNFLFFVHSSGQLENGITKNIDKRRIYIDLERESVYSINNQYAGNSVGLKKLAFRLAIARAHANGWLAEHMFLMGVHGNSSRTTYFAGAFPSACGKTSTAMLPGQNIVGDDIIYAHEKDGELRAVNVEKGVFGIIENVNPEDDPEIYKALTSPGEIIFSNVLISDNLEPYWLGMKKDPPANGGKHYLGHWTPESKDANGKPIPLSHKNARYSLSIKSLPNADKNLNNTAGVPLRAIIYGARDSDTSVPVAQTLSWNHGVFCGACLESETTAATLGKVGVRQHNPYANLDFMSVPLSKYVANHLAMNGRLQAPPLIFCTNYFLKDQHDKFLNHKLDKLIWILWAEARVHKELDAIETPIGFIPIYNDLKRLFKKHLNKDYSEYDYNEQFSIRTAAYLEKLERMNNIFSKIDMPETFMLELEQQRKRLVTAFHEHGEIIHPDLFLS